MLYGTCVHAVLWMGFVECGPMVGAGLRPGRLLSLEPQRATWSPFCSIAIGLSWRVLFTRLYTALINKRMHGIGDLCPLLAWRTEGGTLLVPKRTCRCVGAVPREKD